MGKYLELKGTVGGRGTFKWLSCFVFIYDTIKQYKNPLKLCKSVKNIFFVRAQTFSEPDIRLNYWNKVKVEQQFP